MMTVRAVTAEDMPEICQWSDARGLHLVSSFLSPHGFLALDDGAPVLAVWAYMILDVPVIQLDHLCGCPGLSIQAVREAWQALMRVIAEWVKIINSQSGLNYNVLRCFCEGRMLDEAVKSGWSASAPEYFQIVKSLI